MEEELQWNIRLQHIIEETPYEDGKDVLCIMATIRLVSHNIINMVTNHGKIPIANVTTGINQKLTQQLYAHIMSGLENGVPGAVMIGLMDMAIYEYMRSLRDARDNSIAMHEFAHCSDDNVH